MPTNRLEYESLKTVLLHLDPNLRFQLCLHIPSIRNLDRIVPLKIEHLSFDFCKTWINNAAYSIGIYRQYHNPAETLRYHRKKNEAGGEKNDSDEWSFRVGMKKSWHVLTPEELGKCRSDFQDEIKEVVIYEEVIRRQLKISGKKIERDYIIPELRKLPNAKQIIARNENEIQMKMHFKTKDVQDIVDSSRSRLASLYYKINNLALPYTRLIQFTIKSPKGTIIERVKYSKKMCEGLKYMNSWLFGGRRHPIIVSEISFLWYKPDNQLPADMRIKTRGIVVGCFDRGDWGTVVDKSSYPLDSVTLEMRVMHADILKQNFVRSARKLVIANLCWERQPWLRIIQSLENESIVLRHKSRRDTLEDYVHFIETFLKKDKPAGTNLTCRFDKLQDVLNILELICNRIEYRRMSETKLLLPMNNGLQLEIDYEYYQMSADEIEWRNRAGFFTYGEEFQFYLMKLVVV